MFATEVKLHFLNQQIDLVLRTKNQGTFCKLLFCLQMYATRISCICYINMLWFPHSTFSVVIARKRSCEKVIPSRVSVCQLCCPVGV